MVSIQDAFTNVDVRTFFSITLTKVQFQAVLDILNNSANFSQKFPVYLGVKNKLNTVDDNSIAYTKYDLVLHGYKLNTVAHSYEINEVIIMISSNPLTVYNYGTI